MSMTLIKVLFCLSFSNVVGNFAVPQMSPVNVTIPIYVIDKLPFLQSLPFTGPGFDLGIRDVNREFASSLLLKHTYVTAPNITNCADLIANYDLLAKYYYTERPQNPDVMVLFFAGVYGINVSICRLQKFTRLTIHI